VSQPTLREALRTLEAMGLIFVRHGSGIYLRSGNPLNGVWATRWMQWLLQHAPSLLEMFEVREAVEAKAASLAAGNATPADIRRLDRLLEQAEELLARSVGPQVDEDVFNAYVVLDAAFHETLAEIARNSLLRSLLDGLGSALSQSREATLAIPGRIERSLREHRRVVEAVRRRDLGGARRAMEAHVRRVMEEVRSVKDRRRGRGRPRTERRQPMARFR